MIHDNESRRLLKAYTLPASRFMVMDGGLVHYCDEGAGFPLLLLHGTFSSLHTFDAWSKILSKRFRVLRVDLPGFGLSSPRENIKEPLEEFMSFIARFLNALGIYQCHVAGNSLGGWIAWEFARLYPERIKKMILIDAAGYLLHNDMPLPFKMAKAPLASKIVRYAIKRNILEVFLKQVYGNPNKVTPELVDRYYELFMHGGNAEAFVSMVNGTYKDNSHFLPNIFQPTLILWGEEDKWISLQDAHRFRRDIPNSQVIIYKGVGHVPMEEIPQQSAQDALEFLLAKKPPTQVETVVKTFA